MGKIRLLVLTSLVALFPAAFAQNNAMQPVVGTPHVATRFVNLDTFNLKALIPPPPPSGSFAAQVDLETVLQAQAWRTAEQIAWAKLVEQDNVFNHASIFGAWFKGDRLPMTSMFFKHVGDDMRALEVAAKAPFQRSRPSSIDSWVQPCVSVPASSSYPSGSATQAFVWAELLAEAMPAKRDELRARAHRAAWGRVIGGVHFPSDIVAGRLLAQAYVTECRKSAAFREELDACRKELIAVAASRR